MKLLDASFTQDTTSFWDPTRISSDSRRILAVFKVCDRGFCVFPFRSAIFLMYEMSTSPIKSLVMSFYKLHETTLVGSFFFFLKRENFFFWRKKRTQTLWNEIHLSNNAFHKNNAWIHISLHLHIISFNRQNQLDFCRGMMGNENPFLFGFSL